jgi:hypothetical protein
MKMQGTVTASSQPEVLRYRLQEDNITHGQTVRGDITNVRVGESGTSSDVGAGKVNARQAPVFFCNIGDVKVRKEINAGDGGELPERVLVKDLVVEAPGFYDIENAVITSNGAITVTADEETKVVFVGA